MRMPSIACLGLAALAAQWAVSSATAGDKEWNPAFVLPVQDRQIGAGSRDMASGGMSKTVVSTPHVIVGVFKKADEGEPKLGIPGLAKAGTSLRWEFPGNPYAQSVAASYDKIAGEIKSLGGYYDTLFQADDKVDKINEFLDGKNVFKMKTGLGPLQPTGDPLAVTAAALLNIRVQWKIEGKTLPEFRLADGGTVPGVSMTDGVEYFKSAVGQPLARILTQGGEEVYMMRFTGTIPENSATSAKELAESVAGGMSPGGHFVGLQFPKVKFEWKGDVKELEETEATATAGKGAGKRYFVKKFKLMQRLYINHKGALAQAAGVGQFATRSAAAPPILRIDGPFLVWFKVNGVIAYAGVISKEHMADPGDNF